MKINGIDYEKCINCGNCIDSCIQRCYSFNDDKSKVIFDDSRNWCFLCGHCIAICPVDAVLFESKTSNYIKISPELLPSEPDTPLKIQNLLRSIRSTRDYYETKIPDEILGEIFKTMRYSPSASNMRGWKIQLISDNEKIKNLSEDIQNTINEHNAMGDRYSEKFKVRKDTGIEDPVFFQAPHVIIVSSSVEMDMDALNTGIILTYATISAQTYGIGSCWIGIAQIALESDKALKKKYKIRGKCYGVMILGYPKQKYLRLPPRDKIKIKGFPLEDK